RQFGGGERRRIAVDVVRGRDAGSVAAPVVVHVAGEIEIELGGGAGEAVIDRRVRRRQRAGGGSINRLIGECDLKRIGTVTRMSARERRDREQAASEYCNRAPMHQSAS